MGHVRVNVRVANPADPLERVEIPNALIDTGSTWSVLPRRYADQLRLPLADDVTVRTAAGLQRLRQSYAWLELQGKHLVEGVLVTDSYPDLIIGVTTLEKLGFAVGPKTERLVDSELLLL